MIVYLNSPDDSKSEISSSSGYLVFALLPLATCDLPITTGDLLSDPSTS